MCPPFPGVDLWLSQRSGELSRYGLPNQNGDKVGDLLPTGILSEIGGASPHRGAKFRDCQSACGEKGRSVCVSKLIPSGGVSNNNSYKESMNKKSHLSPTSGESFVSFSVIHDTFKALSRKSSISFCE